MLRRGACKLLAQAIEAEVETHPAEYRVHIRTTNPIESMFSTLSYVR